MTDPLTPAAASDVDLSVIVVSYNTAGLIPRMYAALDAACAGLSRQVVVIDNASRDDSVAVIQTTSPESLLVRSAVNVGFGRANNLALPHLRGRHVLLLNTDAFVADDALHQAIHHLDLHPEVGVIGVRLLGRDGSQQPSCRYFPTPWNVFLQRTGLSKVVRGARLVDDMDWDHLGVRVCDWVPGCFYLVRRTVLDQLGLFDPRYFMYCEEVDHCRRVRAAGWQVVYLGTTSCVHLGGESAATVDELTGSGRQISAWQVESEVLYFRKHHGRAGIAGHLLLGLLGDACLAAKALVRRRPWRQALAEFGHSRVLIHTLGRTRFGLQPTR